MISKKIFKLLSIAVLSTFTATLCAIDVYPKVFRAGSTGTIHVGGLNAQWVNNPTLSVGYVRSDGRFADGTLSGAYNWEPVKKFGFKDKTLTITHPLHGEHEHTFSLTIKNNDGKESAPIHVKVYSLKDDLFKLRPYKGDFHMHSTESDGNLSPERVVPRARAKGLDFMALTDHRKYQPSLTTIKRFANVPMEMKIMPGEEVHPANTPPHIVNFGGSFSVNDYFKTNAEEIKRRIDAKIAALPKDSALDDTLKFQLASTETAFELIQKGGGIAMYCHPYWRSRQRNHHNMQLVDVLIERAKFDALEIIGGFELNALEDNALAVAKYQQTRAQGKVIPVAGVSDAHSYKPKTSFWWYYTVVFAKSPEMKDIAEAIRADRSLAVENVQLSFPRYYGDFRLIRFMYFLHREFYPIHDAVCAKQALLLDRVLDGDQTAIAELEKQKHAVRELFAKYYQ